MRFCLALKMRSPVGERIAKRFESPAIREYRKHPEQYVATWSDVLPPDMAARSSRTAA